MEVDEPIVDKNIKNSLNDTTSKVKVEAKPTIKKVKNNTNMEVDQDPGEIDLKCKEELIDNDQEPASSPIQARRTALKETNQIFTAEKVIKGNFLAESNGEKNTSTFCQRTRDQTHNLTSKSLNEKKTHVAKRTKDISSLKRNLTDVFDNISKKDTLDEVSEFTDKIQIMKTPMKEEAKQSLFDYITPLKNEGFSLNNSAFNSVANTPMKPNYEDYKHLIPSLSDTKFLGQKKSIMPQFMQMVANSKENQLRGYPDTFDSQQL